MISQYIFQMGIPLLPPPQNAQNNRGAFSPPILHNQIKKANDFNF